MTPGEPLSSSWLTRRHRTSHFANTRRPATVCEGLARARVSQRRQWHGERECEGLTRDAQLNASFGRLSGRIGTAALCAPVAQRIERRFPKPCVGGSSPLRGATFPLAASAFSFLMPTFRISIFSIPQKSTCAWWSDVLTMAPQFQSVTPYDSLWILRETGRRRGLWRIPGKLGAEGARRNTCSQAFR